MNALIEFLKTDNFLLIICIVNVILFLGFLIILVKMTKLSKEYKNFMSKIGDGRNLSEDLRQYMNKVGEVDLKTEDLLNYCKELEQTLSTCIKRVGVVRYSAFRDTGSDLSFALALLDDNNNGVVLNGIYSREMSNIYAKPVEKGTSTYTLSEEEAQAINKAISSKK